MMTFNNIEEKRNVDAVMMHILRRMYEDQMNAGGKISDAVMWSENTPVKFPTLSQLNRVAEEDDDEDDFDYVDCFDSSDLVVPLGSGEPDVVTWLRGAVIDGMQTGQLLQYEADEQPSESPDTLE
jgi:hypothetical protein